MQYSYNVQFQLLASDQDLSWESFKQSGRSCPKRALRILHIDFNMPFEVLLTRTEQMSEKFTQRIC